MKKAPLLITVLAASLSFAQIEITGTRTNTSTEYTPTIKIKNKSQEVFIGFKLYAYVANEELEAEKKYLFYDKTGSGAEMNSMSKMNPGSDYVQRIEMNFADVILWPDQELPPVTYFQVKSYFDIGSWRGFYNDPDFKEIVIESKDGRVLHSKHPDFRSRVGVLGLGSTCPSQITDYYVTMDTEHSNNETSFKDNVTGNRATGFQGVVVYSSSRVRFSFCAVDFYDLKPVPYDYVVLRMDANCPAGTYPFRRYHDLEDKNNHNEAKGHGWPSVVNKDAQLEFCFVPGTSNAMNEFPLDGKFEFFANVPSSNTVVSATLHVDDEDSNNKNDWFYYGLTREDIKTRINRIIYDVNKKDTRYKVIRRLGSIQKRAEVADNGASISAGNMVVVNQPAAAVLKGFDHSSVSFEIETAGNTKVTITNAKGAAVAKIAKENLAPGIHHVEWHSGIVPNGVYFVSIEHNGKTSANTVILK